MRDALNSARNPVALGAEDRHNREKRCENDQTTGEQNQHTSFSDVAEVSEFGYEFDYDYDYACDSYYPY